MSDREAYFPMVEICGGFLAGTTQPVRPHYIEHGGVYAGLYDFANGPEPAVYSYNTKQDVGNLRSFTDVD